MLGEPECIRRTRRRRHLQYIPYALLRHKRGKKTLAPCRPLFFASFSPRPDGGEHIGLIRWQRLAVCLFLLGGSREGNLLCSPFAIATQALVRVLAAGVSRGSAVGARAAVVGGKPAVAARGASWRLQLRPSQLAHISSSAAGSGGNARFHRPSVHF